MGIHNSSNKADYSIAKDTVGEIPRHCQHQLKEARDIKLRDEEAQRGQKLAVREPHFTQGNELL